MLYNLLFANPIYIKCHYQNVNRLRQGQRFTSLAYLSSLVSLLSLLHSLLYLNVPSLTSFSSLDLHTLLAVFKNAMCNQHATDSKVSVHCCSRDAHNIYGFVNCTLSVLTVCTRNATYTKLEWLINHSHSPYMLRMKYTQNLNGLSIIFCHSHSPHMQHAQHTQNLNGLSIIYILLHAT